MKKNKDKDKDLDSRKKELKDMLEKGNLDISEEDLNEIVDLFIKVEDKNKFTIKRLFRNILDFSFNYFIMAVSSLVLMGFFFNSFELENKFLIFPISLSISLILMLFNVRPHKIIYILKMSYFLLRAIALILLLICAYLINNYYNIFSENILFVIYIILTILIYYVVKKYIISKLYWGAIWKIKMNQN